ncbi:MAG: chloride channel protein [Bacteroidales bacterium]|nr:chloride channel protein [Bacteroidales bacterium]
MKYWEKIVSNEKLRKYYKKFLIWEVKHLSLMQKLVIISLIVGICCGLAAVLLKNTVAYTYSIISRFTWFSADRGNILFLLYPMIGIALTVLVIKFFVKDDLSHGVSKVMYAMSRNDGKIKTHNCWSSMATSSITVAFGGSVGLEAPIVLTGSAIASNIGNLFRVDKHIKIILLACGAAGAIAGVFKAPIAGILFAFEVLMLDMTMVAIIPMLISSLSAAMISYFFLGQQAEFSYIVNTPFELNKIIPYLFLGIMSAIVSLYFLKINSFVSSVFGKMSKVWKIIIGGVLLGVLVYIFPPLFGEGYPALTKLLNNDMSSLLENSFFHSNSNKTYLIFIVVGSIIILKAFATAITCSSGGVGGVFAPSLFIGGFVGFLVARLVNLSGLFVVAESNFVLVGMASVMAGVMHSPLTSTFLIAEITGGYALFTPLMIASTISYLVVKPIHKYSIYAEALAKRGDLMTHNKDKTALRFIDKTKLLETNIYKLSINSTLRDVVHAVEVSSRSFFPVVDDDNNFKGVLVLDDVRGLLFHQEYYDKILVRSFMRYSPFFIADINESMEEIIQKFKGVDRYTIMIVDKGKFVGCMSRANVFLAYQRYISESSDE